MKNETKNEQRTLIEIMRKNANLLAIGGSPGLERFLNKAETAHGQDKFNIMREMARQKIKPGTFPVLDNFARFQQSLDFIDGQIAQIEDKEGRTIRTDVLSNYEKALATNAVRWAILPIPSIKRKKI